MRIYKVSNLPAPIEEACYEVHESGIMRSGLTCPACDGGRSGERSFSVMPDQPGFVSLRCWRLGCGHHGKAALGEDVKFTPPTFQPRPFRQPSKQPGPALLAWLRKTYAIEMEAADLFIRDATYRSGPLQSAQIYMPVSGPHGGERGGILRRFGHFEGQKSITYKTTDEPFISWYRPDGSQCRDRLVIVEDQLSAIRAWQLGYTAVALLGTNLSRDKWDEIESNWAGGNPLLALDKDAIRKAVKTAKRYPDLRIAILERDLKDVDNDEIERRLG